MLSELFLETLGPDFYGLVFLWNENKVVSIMKKEITV
jgi:hypothetical protein